MNEYSNRGAAILYYIDLLAALAQLTLRPSPQRRRGSERSEVKVVSVDERTREAADT